MQGSILNWLYMGKLAVLLLILLKNTFKWLCALTSIQGVRKTCYKFLIDGNTIKFKLSFNTWTNSLPWICEIVVAYLKKQNS